jgi:type II secretory pathway component PulJ
MTITIAELIGDPERRAPFWGSIKQGPICQSLPEFLQKFVQHGYQLNEFTIIQALLINPIRFQDDDREAIISWLIFDILPRLQESHARIQTLETTVNMLWRRLSDFIKDLAEALPLEHRHGDDANAAKLRLNFLSIVLQDCKDNLDRDRASDAPRSTSGTGGASGCLGIDRRYKALTDRIQALEKMVQENRDNMESHQSFVMVEESAKTAHGQIVESEVQEPPLQLEALSDAPTSSTCTLSPASVSKMKEISKISRLTIDRLW